MSGRWLRRLSRCVLLRLHKSLLFLEGWCGEVGGVFVGEAGLA